MSICGIRTIREIQALQERTHERRLHQKSTEEKRHFSAVGQGNEAVIKKWDEHIENMANRLEAAEQYGFGETRRGSDQKGPEAGWPRYFNAVKEALDLLKRACNLQQSTSNDCQSQSKEVNIPYLKLEEKEKYPEQKEKPKPTLTSKKLKNQVSRIRSLLK
ncbi:uncharacterized protein FOMMEDRAFT_26907 [Fomitiporia mediterranea MF3/22]|uniref:uncharacterized protein n=1 Tax=Fomitiporia mediterranea (strain MF3/22) TaxID=694068 RepID=UPI0004408E23|nr:uncharacterized protein FOMMEDRAFT_26907 [Fomitiporia mediterranea MF3/22]EJD06165.1 hypothetical protein FOMMEDRAFT_26907 [Fomitiporia mediterranea MF3/22]